jgi:hypothetical protein
VARASDNKRDRKRNQGPPPGVVAIDRSGGRVMEVVLQGSGERLRLTTRASAVSGSSEMPRVGVAAWGQTLVRCRGIEALPTDELVRVLDILGDGELPERVPAWRRACGALPTAGQNRTALLTAWMPGESEAVSDDAMYATAPAALGFAVSLADGCVFASDDAQGVLIVAASGPEGLLVRALRETPGVVGGDAHVEKRLREAAGAVGLHDDAVKVALADSVSPWEGRRVGWSPAVGEALEKRVQGWPKDAGEAAGVLVPTCAAMLAMSDDAAVRRLASLRVGQPATQESVGQRLDSWLVSRRHVAIACAVFLLVLLFAPLLAAKAREAMLAGKVRRAEELSEKYQADARKAAIYEQLNERVWPMTKMLAEISAAAPVHVVVQSVRMDSTAQIDIEGFVQIAPKGPTLEGPPETLLTQFESSLNKLGTLGAVTVVRREVVGDSVEFQISARVRSATSPGSVPMDYAAMPLAEVLYGQGASNDTEPVLASASPTSARARPSGGTRREEPDDRAERDGAIESGRGATADRRPSGESGPASIDGVPTAISDEQIAGMDRATLMSEWRARLSASRDTKNDEQTRARLAEEATKLIERFRALGSEG